MEIKEVKTIEKRCQSESLCPRGKIFEQPFLVSNKDGDDISAIKMKNLNAFISIIVTIMKVLHLIKNILNNKDDMCYKNPNDIYFCVPFIKNIKHIPVFSGKINYSNAFEFVLVQVELLVFSKNLYLLYHDVVVALSVDQYI